MNRLQRNAAREINIIEPGDAIKVGDKARFYENPPEKTSFIFRLWRRDEGAVFEGTCHYNGRAAYAVGIENKSMSDKIILLCNGNHLGVEGLIVTFRHALNGEIHPKKHDGTFHIPD